ncbi:MAG: hypothetical protein D6725_04740 [Planctomycetota bacterium]|nr:MAG: hypothetical protein D6725_04740 [Planctomycetota bacterium]
MPCCWITAADQADWGEWESADWLGAVASRLSRFPARAGDVFCTLRSVVAACGEREAVVTVAGTTLAPYLDRLADAHARRRIVVTACDGTVERWIADCATLAEELARGSGNPRNATSGAALQLVCWKNASHRWPRVPWRDVLAAALPDVLFVLGVRKDGHVHRTVRERLLSKRDRHAGRRTVLVLSNAIQADVRRELVALGAEVAPSEQSRQPNTGSSAAAARPGDVGRSTSRKRRTHGDRVLRPALEWDRFRRWLRGATAEERARAVRCWRDTVLEWLGENGLAMGPEWEFLTHWTRTPLLDERFKRDRTLLDRLLRDDLDDPEMVETIVLRAILDEAVVRASAEAIRGGYRVTCWTATPLWLWPLRRVFRSHRVRWDFDWYGVCIQRDLLESWGARPVRYGTEAQWRDLPEADRRYFHLVPSRADAAQQPGAPTPPTQDAGAAARGPAADRPRIDWSIEQEWRVPGDCPLRQALASGRGFAFVRTARQAATLRDRYGWPTFAFELLWTTTVPFEPVE